MQRTITAMYRYIIGKSWDTLISLQFVRYLLFNDPSPGPRGGEALSAGGRGWKTDPSTAAAAGPGQGASLQPPLHLHAGLELAYLSVEVLQHAPDALQPNDLSSLPRGGQVL